jgi:uncharacterized protein YbjT (DUF2867 family)
MIAVIGAAGRSGAALCRALLAAGRPFRPVVRNAAHWIATGITAEAVFAELDNIPELARALAGAETVVSTAPAGFTRFVLQAAPGARRFVLMGSTRRFSRWPDPVGDAVRDTEAAFLASGRAGMMLHPTMIYGGGGADHVRRLAAALRRLPLLPLPGGGTALVQPIHQDDVTACLLAALDAGGPVPEALVVAGPQPLPYRDFAAAVAAAAGLRPPRFVAVPTALLQRLAPLARPPLLPRIAPGEVQRLTEGQAFDVGPMRARLGVVGRPLAQGLAQAFRTA